MYDNITIFSKRFHNSKNPTVTKPHHHKTGSQSHPKYTLCPLHWVAYLNLSPTHRTESGGPVIICFPSPHSSSCAELLLPVGMHLKGAGSLSADMLQCRTAPASAAYQLKMISIQPVVHTREFGNICFTDRDDDIVMFPTSDLGSLHVHSRWAKNYYFKK